MSIAALVTALLVSASAEADPFAAPGCASGDPICATSVPATQSTSAATPADALVGTPFSTPINAAHIPELAQGRAIRRSTSDNSLTAEDRASLREIGARSMHSSVVLLHEIPKRSAAKIDRLQKLARAVDALAPSHACDFVTADGPGTGMCSGETPGPLGNVGVRMPVATSLRVDPNGVLHFVLVNPRAMEVKPFFSWSRVVDPGQLKLVVDLIPYADAWLVYTRINVDMRDHASSARTITDALEKVDAFIVKDLAR